MTQVGYCIRRKEEFNPCKKCGLAIPVKKLWGQFKHYDISIRTITATTAAAAIFHFLGRDAHLFFKVWIMLTSSFSFLHPLRLTR